eukprot:2016859-Rhodomonas_salina.1
MEVERDLEEEKSTEVLTEVEREEAESTEPEARVSTVERSRLRCRLRGRGRRSQRHVQRLSYTCSVLASLHCPNLK